MTLPFWVTLVSVSGAPIGTETVEITLPTNGLLITCSAPGPVGALARTST